MKQTLWLSFPYSFNVAKVFRKVGVLIFFAESLGKHQRIILFSSYCCKLERYTSTRNKVIKITSSYQIFQPDPQLATMQSYYFKKHFLFQHKLNSYFCRLYCWLLHYSASLWIHPLSSECAYTLKFAFPNLLKLAY